MTEPTLAKRTEMIAKMRAEIEFIENISIPDAHENAARCRKQGRYASAADYMRLAWDLRNDAFALQRCVDNHVDALNRVMNAVTAP